MQDRSRADVLHADRVLRPADRVGKCRRALAPAVVREQIRDLEERLARRAARFLHHLGSVAREVPPHEVDHAARMREGLVALGHLDRPVAVETRHILGLELPGARVVGARNRRVGLVSERGVLAAIGAVVRVLVGHDEAREHPVEIFGILEFLTDDVRRVGERDDVLAEIAFVGQEPTDERAEKDDVRAAADRRVHVGDGRGAREARIDVDDLRTALFGFHDEAERDRMTLREIRALDEDAIRIHEILYERGRAAAAERGA